MYAIVETGGKQYRVKPGDTLAVERLTGEPGATLDFERVLLVGGNGDAPRIGTPGVDGAVVRAEVVEHIRGEKIIVFRYKSKVRYRRKTGHRQSLTRLRITDIVLDGKSTAEAQPAARPTTAAPQAAVAEPVPAPPVVAEPVAVVEPVDAAETADVAPAPRRRRSAAANEPAEQPIPESAEELPASAGEGGPEPETEEELRKPENGS